MPTFASHDGRLESGGYGSLFPGGTAKTSPALPLERLAGDPRTTSGTELTQPGVTLLLALNLNGGSRGTMFSFE